MHIYLNLAGKWTLLNTKFYTREQAEASLREWLNVGFRAKAA